MSRSPGSRRPTAARLLLALVVPALVLAGCDRGAAGEDESTEAGTPATTESEDPSGVLTPPPLNPEVDQLPTGTVLVDPGGGATELPVAVRIASTDEARRFGLMEVPDLPDDVGMWFTYGDVRTGGFWMRNTLVDLDIAWIGAAGRIVAIATMEVCVADPCPSHEPGAPYRHALEVPSGWLAANDVEVGDTAELVGTSP